MPTAARRDFSPTTKLQATKGELWLEVKLKKNFFASPRESKLLDSIIGRVQEKRIGKYTGRSSGGGAMDVTFDVKDRAKASTRLRQLMTEEFPGVTFSVSARYLARFHDANREPPPSQQISIEDVEALIAQLEAEDAVAEPKRRASK